MNISEILVGLIVPGATNPRKNFPAKALEELAESICQHGVVQPILVRPDWCVGCVTHGALDERRGLALASAAYEIVCGERRWRGSKVAEKETVPCIVRELTDGEAREIQLIENLQRADLDVVEEAMSYAELLALRDDEGTLRYSLGTLAAKIGKHPKYVTQRLSLMKLPGEEWREALREGVVTFSALRLVALIPSARLRERCLREVLHPDVHEDPLNVRQTADLIRARYMVEVKSAPFPLNNAALVPVKLMDEVRCGGGACEDCPFLSGNMEELAGTGNKLLCTNPECYAEKCDMAWEETRSAALKAGKRVLSDEEAEKVLDPHTGDLTPYTEYVDIAQQVPQEDLMDGVKRAPSWKKVLAEVDVKPEIVVVRDAKGRTRELVSHRQAVAAVKLQANKTGVAPVLKVGTRKANRDEASEAEQRKKKEEQRMDLKLSQEGLLELFKQVSNHGAPEGIFDLLMETVMGIITVDARWYLCTTLNLDAPQGEPEKVKKALVAHFEKRGPKETLAAIVCAVVANDLRWNGSKGEVFARWVKAYSVDLPGLKKSLVAEVKEKKKGKAKRGKAAVAEGVEEEN